jgi:deazaflavin-dependent oxidoreductase (nitroreductase family)
MGAPSALTDFGMRAMNGIHRVVLAVTGGRIGRMLGRMHVVELHTIGRRTGAPRSTLLTAPIFTPDRLVLVASKGGNDTDPQWYQNLCAQPEVEITIDDARHRFHARTATPEEKRELWPEIVRAYRGYARYQSKTDRDIPVVICELSVESV